MKKLMFVAVLALVAHVGFGQTATATTQSELGVFEWAEATHDFGKIKQGVPVTFEFKFTNKGKVPLVIVNAQPSCGCTTPSWTREPVLPGGEGYVKATFNAGAIGPFDKTVSVTANIGGGVVTLHIKGEVLQPETTVKPN
jgi:hypothetical protein